MMKKFRKKLVKFAAVNPQAAGIDVGSRFHWVSIGEGADNHREFGVFTEDLHRLCQWLVENGVMTVALESTGVYWKQLFFMLQSYGLEAILVNASYTKNVRGRKPSDKADSGWIWKLHTAGLLPGSFQPDTFTEELRAYTRHRKRFIEDASKCVNRMQKCMVLMNIQLPIVLSDIMGASGRAIIQAILSGERDGKKMAELVHGGVKADKETIAKALTGFWQDCYLFELENHWETYHFIQEKINRCDQKIEELLISRIEATGQNDLAPPKKKMRRSKNSPNFDLYKYAYQLSDGVDLFSVAGVGPSVVLVFLSEVGFSLRKHFRTAKHFISWLCLSPNNKVSGGKTLSSKTRKSNHRLRQELRQAAISAGNSKGNPLYAFYRRIAARTDKGTAIVATARKIAAILYNMLVNNEQYQPTKLIYNQKQARERKIKQIQRSIQKLGITTEDIVFASST